jgi:hypothetical protein
VSAARVEREPWWLAVMVATFPLWFVGVLFLFLWLSMPAIGEMVEARQMRACKECQCQPM